MTTRLDISYSYKIKHGKRSQTYIRLTQKASEIPIIFNPIRFFRRRKYIHIFIENNHAHNIPYNIRVNAASIIFKYQFMYGDLNKIFDKKTHILRMFKRKKLALVCELPTCIEIKIIHVKRDVHMYRFK